MERVKYQEELGEFNIQPPLYEDVIGRSNQSAYNPKLHPGQAFLAGQKFGMDRKELAAFFGISTVTIDLWRRTYPKFRASWLAGRDIFDGERMEKALRDLALGYEYEEKEYTRTKIPVNGDGRVRMDGSKAKFKYGMRLTKTVKRRHKPDGKAIIFWLTNRMKDRWQHIKTLEVQGQITEKKSFELIVELRLSQLRELDAEQLIELRSVVSKFTDTKLIDDRSGNGGEKP